MTCQDPVYTHTLGETDETLEVGLTADAAAVDLTGAAVVLELVNRKTRAAVEFPLVATTAATGEFELDWEDGEPVRGDYNARFRITLLGGAVRYSPTGEWMLYRFS